MSDFVTDYLTAVCARLYDAPQDNTDPYRHPGPRKGPLGRLKSWGRRRLTALAGRLGYTPRGYRGADETARAMGEVLARADGLGRLYGLLADDASRRTLLAVLAYRTLGPERVRLPLSTPAYWRRLDRIRLACLRAPRTFSDPLAGDLDEYDLSGEGFPVRLHLTPAGVMATFAVEQYRYAPAAVEARPGDVVIDGGGCWGDAALYFAHKAGPGGRVYSFEFVPRNAEIFRASLALNPALAPRVEIVPHPLWDRSGQAVGYSDTGPGSAVTTGAAPLHAETLSLDDFVARAGLPRVDFVKLDIEGAEPAALRGAEQTLRRFRPRLAVALYHGLDDFVTIPAYLAGLGLGYRFHLGHFTIHQEETVLFADHSSASAVR